jgi:hypothetical protein
MSATTVTQPPRRYRVPARHGSVRAAKPRAWSVRAVFLRLRGRFHMNRFPVYVSAFEAEHLYVLAEWSDCRTGTMGQPSVVRRQGRNEWT